MAERGPGIGNVIPNAALVQMAMSYSRSRMVCTAAQLGIADALGDEVRSVEDMARACQADTDALYRLLRALASIGITTETVPKHFRLTALGKPLRKAFEKASQPHRFVLRRYLRVGCSILAQMQSFAL